MRRTAISWLGGEAVDEETDRRGHLFSEVSSAVRPWTRLLGEGPDGRRRRGGTRRGGYHRGTARRPTGGSRAGRCARMCTNCSSAVAAQMGYGRLWRARGNARVSHQLAGGQAPVTAAEGAGPYAGRRVPGRWLDEPRLVNGSLEEQGAPSAGRKRVARAVAGDIGKQRALDGGGAAPDRPCLDYNPSVASPAVCDVLGGVSPGLRGVSGSLRGTELVAGYGEVKPSGQQGSVALRAGRVAVRSSGTAADAQHGRAVDIAGGLARQASPAVRAHGGKCGQPSHLCAPGVAERPSAQPTPSEHHSLPWFGSETVGSDGVFRATSEERVAPLGFLSEPRSRTDGISRTRW